MSKRISLGVIMDGNRRWAKARGMSSTQGHTAGKEALLAILDAYDELRDECGITDYIFYAFSTENWKRSSAEVSALMLLLKEGLQEFEKRVAKRETHPRIRFIGDHSYFSDDLQKELAVIEERTKDGDGVVALALSYGGRDEIVRAFQKVETVSEEEITKALDTHDIQDPDLIIRTGGEKRLSNFLLWQSAYSELFFLDTLWPDFTKEDLKNCIAAYSKRERRHGT